MEPITGIIFFAGGIVLGSIIYRTYKFSRKRCAMNDAYTRLINENP